MRNNESKNGIGDWIIDQIDRNLIIILFGAGMIYQTFHSADATTSRDITEINKKLDKLDAIYVRVCRLEANAQLGECK